MSAPTVVPKIKNPFGQNAVIAVRFARFLNQLGEWSHETFGDAKGRDATGPFNHFKKEIVEVLDEADPEKRKIEIADLIFLAFDAAWRNDMDLEEIVAACEAKLVINKARKWPAPTAKGIVEHVKE